MNPKLEKRKVIAPGVLATPTILLFIVLMALYISVSYLGYTGQVSLYVCLVINSILSYLFFTPMHDACHGSIAGKHKKFKSIETAIGYLSGIALLAPFPILKLQHLKHHAHTNHPHNDPDYYINSSSLPMAIIKSVGVFLVAYFNVFKLKSLGNKKLMINTLFMNFTLNAVFIALAYKFGVLYPLMIWFFPGIIGLSLLSIFFAWIPHHPQKETNKYRSSRIIKGQLFKWITLYQSYHLIHHLYPKIPFYRYKKAYTFLESELVENNAIIISSSELSLTD